MLIMLIFTVYTVSSENYALSLKKNLYKSCSD